jgi:hypothetical protein
MQTSVGARPSIGVPGDISSFQDGDVPAVVNKEASNEIAFGLMMKKGTADNDVLRCSSLTDVLAGVAVRAHDFARGGELGDTGVKPGCVFGALRKGRVFVTTEDAVTKSSEVHARMVAGQGGAALVVPDFTFTAEADTDLATAVGHGLITGDGPFRVSNSGGALPTGISAATDYWVIRVDDDNFKFASTRANALAGTAIDLSDDGTGTQTMADTASTERVVTGLAGAFRGTPDGSPLVVADSTFTAEADDDTLTDTAHGLLTGDGPVRVSNSGGALPTGLSAGTDYWVIKIDADKMKLASSRANALAGTAIALSTDGTGTQTMSDTADTERITTLDLTPFARWKRSAGIGEVCELEIDLSNAALAEIG